MSAADGGIAAVSARFRRAAAREREQLLRRRDRVVRERDARSAALREAEARLAEIDLRLEALAELAGSEQASGDGRGDRELRGAAIRKVAVGVLRASFGEPRPVHYRRWLEMLHGAGYSVAGEHEDAVFLCQLLRSPVVRSTTRPGVYELDIEAPRRLQAKLERCHGRLAEVAAARPSTEARRIRDELLRTQERIERDLAEATEVLPDSLAGGTP
jgi:hypothetical protein